VTTGRLDVDGGALDHALQAGRGLGIDTGLHDQAAHLVLEILAQDEAEAVQVHRAGLEHGHRVRILGERHQEMFQRGVFVLLGVGQCQCPPQRLFQIT
jgi:hypothetical protein